MRSVTVALFTAAWCSPCDFIKAFFVRFSDSFTSVYFVVIDIDELPIIRDKYFIHKFPTFVTFSTGGELDRLVGSNVDALERFLNDISRNKPLIVYSNHI